MSNSNKYIITALTIISVACIAHVVFSMITEDKIEKYEQNGIFYEDRLTQDDMDNNKFKVQYQVRGIADMGQKINIMGTIKKAIEKIERIIPRSNKLNYITEDTEIPITNNNKKFIKDLYLIITISDENIKEASGEASKDTIGGSNIKETKTIGQNIFPVVGTIQLLKNTVLEDINHTYDTIKYPYTDGLNRFYYVLLHEIFHVLGVGFLWTDPDYDPNLPQASYNRYWIRDVTKNPVYVGPSLPKYNNLSATVYYYSKFIGKPGELKAMPIENDGQEGTALWHWEQGTYQEGGEIISKDNRQIGGIKTPGLDYEIMVGWGTDKPPILSTITIANLEDLGYTVNYNEAEIDSLLKLESGNPIQAPVETPYTPESVGKVREQVIKEMTAAENKTIISEEAAYAPSTDELPVPPSATTTTQKPIETAEELNSKYRLSITLGGFASISLMSCCCLLIVILITQIV